ncbi:MAG: response regulator transcription factor [Propionibacteriaceae bacterium]|nr:response regulator transcription factor [Propionibacteriaceae bacterium]
MGSKTSVLIVDRHATVGEAFAEALKANDHFTVLSPVTSLVAALASAARHKPSIALVDIHLPDDQEFQIIDHLRTIVPTIRTLVISDQNLPGYCHRSMHNNAWAHLHKGMPLKDIISAIEKVDSGQRLLTQDLLATVEPSPLSHRETQILETMARNGPTSKVHEVLGLSNGTINNYISSILTKLDSPDRLHAIITATAHGWIRPYIPLPPTTGIQG